MCIADTHTKLVIQSEDYRIISLPSSSVNLSMVWPGKHIKTTTPFSPLEFLHGMRKLDILGMKGGAHGVHPSVHRLAPPVVKPDEPYHGLVEHQVQAWVHKLRPPAKHHQVSHSMNILCVHLRFGLLHQLHGVAHRVHA